MQKPFYECGSSKKATNQNLSKILYIQSFSILFTVFIYVFNMIECLDVKLRSFLIN